VKHGFRGQEPINKKGETTSATKVFAHPDKTIDDFERRDPSIAAIMIGLAYFAMVHTFREISSGSLNPAIVLAQIMWQTTTFKY